MAAVIDTIVRPLRAWLNRLLPFTDPNTPLLQDITHTIALFALFYYAPRLLERRHPVPMQPRGATALVHATATAAAPLPHTEAPEGFEPFDDDDEPLEQGEEPLEDPIAPQDPAFPPPPPPPPPPPLRPNHPAAGTDNNNIPFPQPPAAPAAEAAGPSRPTRTNIGPKKAASLARRDQRRAYHEFVQQEAAARRQREAEGQEERDEALWEEKRRRAVVEMEVEERARREREERRGKAGEGWEVEMGRRERVVAAVREGVLGDAGCVDLGAVARREGGAMEWARGLAKASGLLGVKKGEIGKEVRLLTAGGWVVRVDRRMMDEAYKKAIEEGTGRVSLEDMGKLLEDLVRRRAAV